MKKSGLSLKARTFLFTRSGVWGYTGRSLRVRRDGMEPKLVQKKYEILRLVFGYDQFRP